MRKILLLAVAAIGFLPLVQSQSLYDLLADTIDVVVAADGSGDYTTLTDAIEASSGNQVIFIKNGVYFEKIEITSSKKNITLIGEDVDSTIIEYDDYSGRVVDGTEIGTSTSETVKISANSTTFLNLTVKNSAGRVGQAVAINLNSDKIILAHCRFLGNQDTFYTWNDHRQFMKDCYIEGNTDYIFGDGAALFDSCVLNANASGSKYTAASTAENWNFGYVFKCCSLTANRGISKDVVLGRPWKTGAQTVFMECYLGNHITAAGWQEWDSRGENGECFYAEYNNYGPGSGTSGRVSWSSQLSSSTAALFTMENIFSGDVSTDVSGDWYPDLYTNPLYMTIRNNTDLLYNQKFNSAYLDSLTYNGDTVPGFKSGTVSYTIELDESTVDVPVIEAFPASEKAYVDTIIYPDSLPGNATIKVVAGNEYTLNYKLKFTFAVGVSENLTTEKATLLSNVISNDIVFEFEDISSELQLVIYNTSGKIAYRENFHASNEQKSFEVGSFPQGVYYYKLQYNNEILTGKFLKTL